MSIAREWLGIAIAIHVLSLIWWIGGLAFLAAVEFPALQNLSDESKRTEHFRQIEIRSRTQVRLALIFSGLSGVILLAGLGGWSWLGKMNFWWLDAMIVYWLAFALLLFVLEPTGTLERIIAYRCGKSMTGRQCLHRLHVTLLVIGLMIIAVGAASTHKFV